MLKGAGQALERAVDTIASLPAGIEYVFNNPQDAYQDVTNVACEVGTNIARLAHTIAKMDTATELQDSEMLAEVHANLDAFFNPLEQHIAQATYLEMLEGVGSGVTDAVVTNMLFKFAVTKTVQGTKDLFSKMGETGRKIKQAAGLEYVKKVRELKHPKAVVSFAGGAGIDSVSILKNEIQPISNRLVPSATAIDLARIANFDRGIDSLSAKYGKEILKDAKQALRINEYKILKKGANKFLREVEETCSKIKKVITSKPHRKNFIYDVGHSFKVTEGSIMEALTACAAEDQGLFNKLKRASVEGVDYIDMFNKKWDIKSPISKTVKHPFASFRKDKIIKEIVLEMSKGENILLDVTDIINCDYKSIIKDLSKLKVGNNMSFIVLHRDVPNRSFVLFEGV